MAIKWDSVVDRSKYYGNVIKSWITDIIVYILYYGPIIRTKFIEFTTYVIRLRSHMNPIRIDKNTFVLITGSNLGDQGRYVMNIFYKRYNPYDLREFIEYLKTHTGEDSIRFRCVKFTT